MKNTKNSQVKVGMLSLGCARNLVDAEVILGYLEQAGFSICPEISQADVAIVNTCSFIREAEEESIDVILKLCRLKEEGSINRIIVCGCLAQRYKSQLPKELKQIDAFVGVGSIDKVASIVKQVLAQPKLRPGEFQGQFLYSHLSPRVPLSPRHFAYVKISDGCNHACSYCVIPKLRGKYRSRPIDSIVQETEMLFKRQGASEINLIGQDTTMYGRDLYGASRLAELLRRISNIARGKWIRLLYAHPAHFSPEVIEAVKQEPAICKYIDLPIQHINDKILKKMRRGTSRRQILSLIETLRKEIPHLALRTTLIVGFPGETDRQFRQLLDFIREVRFERLGLFKYSRESGTQASKFSRQLPEKTKHARYAQALSLQQDISTELNQGYLGKDLAVLIDEPDQQEKDLFIGRTEHDAPEVDGCVYTHSKRSLRPGDFVQVRISDTLEYDLVGRTR